MAHPWLQIIHPRGIVPENLALRLGVDPFQREEEFGRVREPAVEMRVIGGKKEVVGPQAPDHVCRRVLVYVDVDKALAVEVLAGLEREWHLLIVPLDLPVLIEPIE